MRLNNKTDNKIPKLRFCEFSNEWEEKKLSEIATFSLGKGISKTDIDHDGKHKCIRYGELYTEYNEVINRIISRTNVDKNESVLCTKGDLLIPSSGETAIDIATASCVNTDKVLLGGDINIVSLQDKNDGHFFAYYLSNFKKKNIARFAQGISVIHLYNSNLKDLDLRVPIFEEQQKIAIFLSSVDNWITNLEKQKASLEEYKKGMMQKIFSREIRFRDENGNEYPEWEEKKLEKIGLIVTGTTPPTEVDYYYGGDIPWITPTDIGKSRDIFTSERMLTQKGLETGRFIKSNSILVTCIASIGKNAILRKDGSCNQQINAITVDNHNNVEFIYYLIEYNQQELERFASSGSLKILNKKDFSSICLLFPKLREQQKIASFLSSIDNLIESKDKQINKSKKWKKGLLQRMFI